MCSQAARGHPCRLTRASGNLSRLGIMAYGSDAYCCCSCSSTVRDARGDIRKICRKYGGCRTTYKVTTGGCTDQARISSALFPRNQGSSPRRSLNIRPVLFFSLFFRLSRCCPFYSLLIFFVFSLSLTLGFIGVGALCSFHD